MLLGYAKHSSTYVLTDDPGEANNLFWRRDQTPWTRHSATGEVAVASRLLNVFSGRYIFQYSSMSRYNGWIDMLWDLHGRCEV
jgi:hypothetical protein